MQNSLIPNQIRSFLRFLENAGFQAFLVGGCVRDSLMNRAPRDWDVCTDALPHELQSLFPDALTYGMQHGTVTVKWDGLFIEVTTFRAEGAYSDHRRPDEVTFIHDLRTDLARRDFTINAIAMDAEDCLHDPFNGIQDLHACLIRAVGNPEERFREDALRMLRAVRFSAQLDFNIEPKTTTAMKDCASLSASLSAERVAQEVEKTLMTDRPERVSEMISIGLVEPWAVGSMQDTPEKLKRIAPERIRRWCGFCFLVQNTGILSRLRLDRKTVNHCYTAVSIRAEQERDLLFWKYAIHRYGKQTAQIAADVLSAWDQTQDAELLRLILGSGACCTISELAISGIDLKNLGLRGKEIGAALEIALRHVWKCPEQNEHDVLLQYLREEFIHG